MSLLFLCALCIGNVHSSEIDLSLYEQSVYSQNGEDGVLAKIFDLIGTTSRFCVELGAYDGRTTSKTYLLRLQGWSCLLLDQSHENLKYNLHREFITRENINDLFYKYDVPSSIDLMSIDIDYNNFHVWQAIEALFEANVVVIESNPAHLPNEDKVVPYRRLYTWDGTNYHGASILAYYNLGRAKGYSLVYQESSGRNLFFIKDSILEEKNLHFKNMNDVEKIYRRANYAGDGPNGGNPADLKKRKYKTSLEQIK